MPTWCCPTPPTSSGTTACRCSTGRSPSSTGRWIRCASRCCRPRASAGRSRRCWSNWRSRLKFPAFVTPDGIAQVPRLPRLHRQLRDRARLGHRLPRRLARQGRREVDARRAEPEPVGDVRQEQLRLPPPHGARTPVHAQLEPGLHGLGAERRAAPRQRSDRDPHLLGIPAGLPARGAGQAAGQAAAGPSAQARRDLLRPAALLLRAARGAGHRPHALPAERGDAAADGDVPLVGFAERLAAPDPHPQLPVRQSAGGAGGRHRRRRLDVGRVANGARCAACAATPRRWSPARCGPGTPSARRRAPGD